MYIMLGPTRPNKSESAECQYVGVAIQHPFDELTIDEVWVELIRPALLAYGFGSESVDKLVEQ